MCSNRGILKLVTYSRRWSLKLFCIVFYVRFLKKYCFLKFEFNVLINYWSRTSCREPDILQFLIYSFDVVCCHDYCHYGDLYLDGPTSGG